VIFVHGCFWHGGHSGCRRASLPATNRTFWSDKIRRNMDRDRRDYRRLKRLGWDYLAVWQCRTGKLHEAVLRRRIESFLARVRPCELRPSVKHLKAAKLKAACT
jgi:DNA mismatch endonuclease (patch repair protein)